MTGSDGSVASTTAMPFLGGDGQKRVFEPLAQSEKPQWPTYAKPSCTHTSALKPRPPRVFWPTTSMFLIRAAFWPPVYVLFD